MAVKTVALETIAAKTKTVATVAIDKALAVKTVATETIATKTETVAIKTEVIEAKADADQNVRLTTMGPATVRVTRTGQAMATTANAGQLADPVVVPQAMTPMTATRTIGTARTITTPTLVQPMVPQRTGDQTTVAGEAAPLPHLHSSL